MLQTGLFIHTGRTGQKSYAMTGAIVHFVSGQKLLDLIVGKPLILTKQ